MQPTLSSIQSALLSPETESKSLCSDSSAEIINTIQNPGSVQKKSEDFFAMVDKVDNPFKSDQDPFRNQQVKESVAETAQIVKESTDQVK